MGVVGGTNRVHRVGEAESPPFKWDCPACGAENVNRFEEGCPACGAGTAKQAEMAMAARVAAPPALVTVAALKLAVLAPEFTQYELIDWLTPLSQAARVTVLRALEFYLAQATPLDTTELSLEQLRGWRVALEPPDETTT